MTQAVRSDLWVSGGLQWFSVKLQDVKLANRRKNYQNFQVDMDIIKYCTDREGSHYSCFKWAQLMFTQ